MILSIKSLNNSQSLNYKTHTEVLKKATGLESFLPVA
jgi:hypothetical protein